MKRMRTLWITLSLLTCLTLSGGKSTKLTVQVNSAEGGRPIDRASVIVRFRHGLNVNMKKMVTNWETKTNQEGHVTIPTMPQGEVQIQVIAQNYQTFGDIYQLDKDEQTISIKLNRPQPQYSEDAKPDK